MTMQTCCRILMRYTVSENVLEDYQGFIDGIALGAGVPGWRLPGWHAWWLNAVEIVFYISGSLPCFQTSVVSP